MLEENLSSFFLQNFLIDLCDIAHIQMANAERKE